MAETVGPVKARGSAWSGWHGGGRFPDMRDQATAQNDFSNGSTKKLTYFQERHWQINIFSFVCLAVVSRVAERRATGHCSLQIHAWG